jgi:MoxR-like ATPase
MVLQPFIVLATMNPIEQEGTYPLPEAQQDRFLVKILMDRLTVDQLIEISALPGQDKTDEKLAQIEPVIKDLDEIKAYQAMVDQVELGDHIRTMARIVDTTSPNGAYFDTSAEPKAPRDYLRYGGSPRGVQALIRLARVAALVDGMVYVEKRHIQKILRPALRHRILLRYEYALRKMPDDLLSEIFEQALK